MRLRDLSDDINSCLAALEATGAVTEMNTQGSLLKIVEKLPLYLQGAWRKRVIKFERREDRLPTRKDLCRMLMRKQHTLPLGVWIAVTITETIEITTRGLVEVE
jgi:hypothetical protein